ncbi:MAG: DUF1217 domain-containing protein [Paracoccaceae bacterium]
MTYVPALAGTGYFGWAALKRSQPLHAQALANSPTIKRDEDYFRARIGSVRTADDLVNDPRLLRVALTAYGLEGDMGSRAFVKKVLTDGTLDPEALANRLSDKQYLKFSAAFGFGDYSTPRTQLSDFADKTLALYRARSFEAAVGQTNDDYRLALNAERELPALAGKSSSEDTKWYTVLGNAPLRTVMQTALGLPSSTTALDIDRQLDLYKARAKAQFGDDSLSQFAAPEKMAKLIKTYHLRAEVAAYDGGSVRASAVIGMLSQSIAFAKAQQS